VSDPNQAVHFGNHTLVLLDAPGLVEEDYRRVKEDKVYSSQMMGTPSGKKTGKVKAIWRPTKGGSVEFVKRVSQGIIVSQCIYQHFTDYSVVRSFDANALVATDSLFPYPPGKARRSKLWPS
jgi:hypothetical protein